MIEPVLLAIVTTAFVMLVRCVRRLRVEAREKRWLPADLKNAELVYLERTFKTRRPLQLIARVDRAYRRPDGTIVLVELKTRCRSRAYLSDIIELSAQRLALEAHTGERVADCAYIVVQVNQRAVKVAQRVKLLPKQEVLALGKRREMILAGNAAPRCTSTAALCASCAFTRECSNSSKPWRVVSQRGNADML